MDHYSRCITNVCISIRDNVDYNQFVIISFNRCFSIYNVSRNDPNEMNHKSKERIGDDFAEFHTFFIFTSVFSSIQLNLCIAKQKWWNKYSLLCMHHNCETLVAIFNFIHLWVYSLTLAVLNQTYINRYFALFFFSSPILTQFDPSIKLSNQRTDSFICFHFKCGRFFEMFSIIWIQKLLKSIKNFHLRSI